MGIKAENSMRIKELEEEFSDEKIAELFQMAEEEEAQEATELALYKRKAAARDLVVVAILAVSICIAVGYLLTSAV